MTKHTLNFHLICLFCCITIAILVGGKHGVLLGLTLGGSAGLIIFLYTQYPSDIAITVFQAMMDAAKQIFTPKVLILTLAANFFAWFLGLAVYRQMQGIWLAEVYATLAGYAVLAYASHQLEKHF